MQSSFLRIVFLLLLVSPLPNYGQAKHIQIAKSFVGVKELTGHNDGKEVEMFLKSIGRYKGDSWCAAFVSYSLIQAKVKSPTVRSGMARAFKIKESINAKDVITGKIKVPDGSILIYQKGSTQFGHTGFVVNWNKSNGTTIEGNTSSGLKGSQADGDGVYQRTRYIEPANYFRITAFTEVKYENKPYRGNLTFNGWGFELAL